jgi:hypothetical protein
MKLKRLRLMMIAMLAILLVPGMASALAPLPNTGNDVTVGTNDSQIKFTGTVNSFGDGGTSNSQRFYYDVVSHPLLPFDNKKTLGWTTRGVCSDATYLYVSDYTNNRVRQYWISNYTEKTYVAINNPTSLCLSPDSQFIFIGTRVAATLYKVWTSNMSTKTSVGVTYQIQGICTDGTAVFISLSSNEVARYLCSDLSYTSSVMDIKSPQGLAYQKESGTSYIYVSSYTSKCIYKYNLAAWPIGFLSGSTNYSLGMSVIGIAVKDSYVWISNLDNNKVEMRRSSDLSINVTSVGGTGSGDTQFNTVYQISCFKNETKEHLYFADSGNTRVIRRWGVCNQTYSTSTNANPLSGYTVGSTFYSAAMTTGTLTRGTKYYVRARSNLSSNGTAYDFSYYEKTCGIPPLPPTGLNSKYSGGKLNITWTKGSTADKTYLNYKTGSYPSSPYDGYSLTNTTGSYYNFTYYYGWTMFISLWSWNETVDWWSINSTRFIMSGAMYVNVFNESKPWKAISNYNIEITNQSASQSFYASNKNNTFFLNLSQCPKGICTVKVTRTGYRERIYTMDIQNNQINNLTAYLLWANTSGVNTYFIRIIESVYSGQIPYDVPVNNAMVTIKRFLNNTQTYRTMTNVLTDGNGYMNTWLMQDVMYQIEINKTGYNISYQKYTTPQGNVYYETPEKWFKIYRIDANYSFNATQTELYNLTARKYTNNSIKVTYIDLRSSTINVTLKLYENNGWTESLLYTITVTTTTTYTFWYSPVNTSRMHRVNAKIYSTLGTGKNFTILNTYSFRTYNTSYNATVIENKVISIWGAFLPGYVRTFLIYLPAIGILILVGRSDHALGAIGSGLYLAFISTKVAVSPEVAAIAVVIIALGVGIKFFNRGSNR